MSSTDTCASIPSGPTSFLTMHLWPFFVEGDEEFNEWSRQGARVQAEEGQPIVSVKIK